VKRLHFLNLFLSTLVVLFIVAINQIALAQTFNVSTTPELRQALQDAAGNGQDDLIMLADGTYKTTDDGGGTFTFLDNEDYDLTIQGSSAENVILNGDNTDRVLGLYCSQSILSNITISNGNSSADGGGLYTSRYNNLNIENCIITENTTKQHGGGFYADYKVTITNSIISNNSATYYGGGFKARFGATLIDSIVTGNIAAYKGGGFYSAQYTRVLNCIISSNRSAPGISTFGVTEILNSLIIDNISGGLATTSGSPYILNTAFINNGDFDIDVVATVYNCYVDENKIYVPSFTQGNIFGGNLDFINQENGDFHIGENSVLIDAGTTDVNDIVFPTTDFDGNQRISGGSIDIGPYELSITTSITYYIDYDNDGYGNPDSPYEDTSQPSGYVTDNTDCDDYDSSIHPSATEIRGDGIDQDCNGSDLPYLNTYYRDYDNDGYGDPDSPYEDTSQPSGYVTDNTDCDDYDDSIHPGATEIRGDGVDQNCNGSDLPNLNTYYEDHDGDGYGDSNNSTEAEIQPSGYVTDNTDCDDSDGSIHPDAVETRGDGIDQDCNGVDLLLLIIYYQDNDSDGYGNPNISLEAKSQPEGYVADNTDCDDSDSSVNPGATESCNGVDDNCEGIVDEGCSIIPDKVTLILPSSTTEETTPTFTWNKVSNATWYKIYLMSTSSDYKFVQWYEIADDFSNYPEVNCTDGKCTVKLDSTLDIGSYEWFVMGWNDNGNGVWSDGMAFTIQGNDTLPSKVTHTSPSGATQNSTPTYTWAEDPASTWYRLWVGSPNGDRLFAQWYDATDICSGGICTVTTETEFMSGDYEWYIKSWNDYGRLWSDGMSFTVSE
jgi:hypothetical protein